MLDRVKLFVLANFERILVLTVVAAMLFIHAVIDYKIAFLSFYFLPIITAGFYLGRKAGVLVALMTVMLVAFFQAITGVVGPAGFRSSALLMLGPWAGFLILTGNVVGMLAEQKDQAARDLRETYVTLLELLTFYLEGRDQHRGHSYRVAQTARALGAKIGLDERKLEDLRVAGLLHEIGANDPQLQRLFNVHPDMLESVPVARALRGARDLLNEYARYHELVGVDWPVDQLDVSEATKALAVADAYESLMISTEARPAMTPWSALEEIERGAGRTFGSAAVAALRGVKGRPEAIERSGLVLTS